MSPGPGSGKAAREQIVAERKRDRWYRITFFDRGGAVERTQRVFGTRRKAIARARGEKGDAKLWVVELDDNQKTNYFTPQIWTG